LSKAVAIAIDMIAACADFWRIPRVKPFLILLAASTPLHAELIATMETSKGNIIIELQYAKAPKAVANFITLAKGTRTRVDPISGAVTNAPLYIGEKFFRVLDEPDFKIAQTGSGTGTNVGGPGYTFRDEFDPTLTHVPYVLSMANSGQDTNGSQIFFTGNIDIPSLDNVHTVFGLVNDPESRAVIDAIHTAGKDGTTITGMSFACTDSAAESFDEQGQKLPICSGIAGNLTVTPGSKAEYIFSAPQPSGSVLLGYRSPDLRSWSKLGEVYQGIGSSTADSIVLDAATLPTAFYNLPLVIYQDALAPESMANRTLALGWFGDKSITFAFDATGKGGTAVLSDIPLQPINITKVTYSKAPYKATWVIETDFLPPLRFRGFLKSEDSTYVFGTNTSHEWNGLFWEPVSSGELAFTK